MKTTTLLSTRCACVRVCVGTAVTGIPDLPPPPSCGVGGGVPDAGPGRQAVSVAGALSVPYWPELTQSASPLLGIRAAYVTTCM